MFAHPMACPWNRKPSTLPIACFLTAVGGVLAVMHFGAGSPFAAVSSMAFGIAVLRLLDIHMPPALAVGLIPLIIESPAPEYALSVGFGTAALTLSFVLYRQLQDAGNESIPR